MKVFKTKGLLERNYPEFFLINQMFSDSTQFLSLYCHCLSILQFGMFETMTSAFVDEFPHLLKNRKVLFTAFFCFIEFLLGIPCVMQVTITYLQKKMFNSLVKLNKKFMVMCLTSFTKRRTLFACKQPFSVQHFSVNRKPAQIKKRYLFFYNILQTLSHTIN